MIIDFSITNFRSIKDKKTLYFIAKNRAKDHKGNNVSFKSMKGFKNYLSKGCVIYGHNASGKSNLLNAFSFFCSFIINSQRKIRKNRNIPVTPFLLNNTSKYTPSEFELNFIIKDIRYNYTIYLNNSRVLYESLRAYPKAIEQNWYTREWDDETSTYIWTSGNEELYGFDKSKALETRDNVSFLSYVNETKNDILGEIYNWFDEIVFFEGDLANFSEIYTADQLSKAEKAKLKSLEFLKCVDIGIVDINIDPKEFSASEIPEELKDGMPEEVYNEFISQLSGKFRLESSFLHCGEAEGKHSIDFYDESDGTRKLYKLLTPIFNILETGSVLFFDEIENSLHPLLLIEVLRLFFSELHNPKGAQIIFTAHNTILLDANLFNRDQIWFAEKDNCGRTDIYSLMEYSPRNTESLIRGYLSGRYGATKVFNRECFDNIVRNGNEQNC